MRFLNKAASSLILLFCYNIAGGQTQDGFKNFLVNGFSNFPRWVVENGKEPLFLESRTGFEENTPNVKFDAGVWNQFIHGFSTFEGSEIEGDLLGGSFSFEIKMNNFTVSGNYDINGTVFSTTPIEGQGNFYSTQDGYMWMWWTSFSNLRVINDHIDMSEARRSAPNGLGFVTSLEFEGLRAGGYESQVLEMLHAGYTEPHSSWMKTVILDLLQEYFTELFEETPVSEIIGTTLEPPTDPPTTPSTTTTTEDPCKATSGEIHVEKILEKNTSLSKNGKVITVTREIVLRIKEEF